MAVAANNIDLLFKRLRKEKKKAFIAYVTAGYPSFQELERLIPSMEKQGVDLLELGIPFSDPVADGPTIQFSSQAALEKGVTLKKILSFAGRVSKKTSIPLVFMSYLNPIFHYGVDRFAKDAKKAGVSGAIIPDLIPEEAVSVRKSFKKHGLHLINLISPTTPFSRQKEIARHSKGFLYAVSVSGVTGARKSFSQATRSWLSKVGRKSPVPVCVGFGISGPDQVRQIKKHADGVIVGSAIIDVLRKAPASTRKARLEGLIKKMSKECHNGR